MLRVVASEDALDRGGRGIERLHVALAGRVHRGGRDGDDARGEDHDRRQERHSDEQPVAERFAPLAHAHRADERRALGPAGDRDGRGHPRPSTMRR